MINSFPISASCTLLFSISSYLPLRFFINSDRMDQWRGLDHPIGCSICHRIPKPTSELGGKQFQFWDSMVNLLQRCSVARLGNSSDRLTIFWLCSNFNNWPRIQTLGSQQSRSCQPRTDVKNKVHDRCPLHQTPPITSSSTVGSITPCPN